jgi:hypothetical protein
VENNLNLKKELAKILAGNGNLGELAGEFQKKANPDQQKEMVGLVLAGLREQWPADFYNFPLERNYALLEILEKFKMAEYDVRDPLLNYSHEIHKLRGVRDSEDNLMSEAKAHLLEVGRIIAAYQSRDFKPKIFSAKM